MDLEPAVPTSIDRGPRRRLVVSVCFGATVLAALMLLVMSLALAQPPTFPDVPATHPYYDAITDLASRGIIDGYGNGDFGPGNAVTRRQFAKMIVLTGGYPVSEGDVCTFTDVEKSGSTSFYPDNYVAVAAAHQITKGTGPELFSPDAHISRYQVISMVVRAVEDLKPGLLDVPPASWEGAGGWGDDADHGANARRAEYNGLLPGLALTGLDPWGDMSRGEVAQVLHNLLGKVTPPTTTTTTSEVTTTTTTSLPETTTTTTAPSEQVVYAVGDDTYPETPEVSKQLAALVPLPAQGLSLFCYLGDVQTTGSAADFRRYDSIWGGAGRDLRTRTASIIGNHEVDNLERGWIPYWSGSLVTPWPGSLTQTNPPYYAVKLGSWKVIALDTTGDVTAGGAQYEFLVRELQEPGYTCVVIGHYPRWSNGRHGNNADLDDAWKAMCDYGAVAYVSGHDHDSQIHPRRNRDGTVVATGGCVQLVAGAGGAPLYEFSSGPGFAEAAWGDTTHYAVLRLRLARTEFRADFIARGGSVLHSHVFAVP